MSTAVPELIKKQYKKQIGYGYLLIRAIDRLLDAFYDIDNVAYDERGYSTHIYLQKICILSKSLYSILPPSVKKDCNGLYLELKDACETEYDDMDEALNTIHDTIIDFLDKVINSLDKHNLLIKSNVIPIGGEIDEVVEE